MERTRHRGSPQPPLSTVSMRDIRLERYFTDLINRVSIVVRHRHNSARPRRRHLPVCSKRKTGFTADPTQIFEAHCSLQKRSSKRARRLQTKEVALHVRVGLSPN